jgi:hypothetical protein
LPQYDAYFWTFSGSSLQPTNNSATNEWNGM